VFAQPAGHLQVNPGLPDFINTYNIPKWGKMYQMNTKCTILS
jgi:hypothetical protein